MMDELLSNLNAIASMLLPIAGVIVLIILAMILYRVYVILKKLPDTIAKVDEILVSSNKSLDQLEKPLDTLNSVSGTVDMVNNATQDAVSSITAFSLKHSETVMDNVKDFFDKKKGPRKDDTVYKETYDETFTEENLKEDFGVYDE